MGSDIGQAVGSGVVGQWAASFDGDPTGMTNHQKLSQEAEGWHRRMAGALISGPAVIALAALAREYAAWRSPTASRPCCAVDPANVDIDRGELPLLW